jgi:hypothetical protein
VRHDGPPPPAASASITTYDVRGQLPRTTHSS